MKIHRFTKIDYEMIGCCPYCAARAAKRSNEIFDYWLHDEPAAAPRSVEVTRERLRQIRFKNRRLWEENQYLHMEVERCQEKKRKSSSKKSRH